MATSGQFGPNDFTGWCPACGRYDGVRHVGRVHFGVCDAHRTRWCIGENLLSAWWDEDPATWERTLAYREVDPLVPTAAMLAHYAATGRYFDEDDLFTDHRRASPR